jgi:uncharacterized membrane protein YkoI
MSTILATFDPVRKNFVKQKNIVIAQLTTDDTGKATYTLADKPSRVDVYVKGDTKDTVYDVSYDPTTGTITIYVYSVGLSKTTTSAVTDVTKDTALKDIGSDAGQWTLDATTGDVTHTHAKTTTTVVVDATTGTVLSDALLGYTPKTNFTFTIIVIY